MSQETLADLIPALIILAIVIARLVFVYGGRRGSGGGIARMAVCRKCGRAFPRSFLAPNLMVGKLTRCPHCGAVAILPAASQAELDLAQAREHPEEALPAPPLTPEDELRRRIEQSKYE